MAMPRLNRRNFIQYSTSTIVTSLGATGIVTAGDEEENLDFSEVDDLGNPIDEGTASAGPSTALDVDSDDSVNPPDPPDATIEASTFEWISVEPDEFGDDTTALRLSDDGGVNFNFLYETDGDLTVDVIWRHHSGGDLAYLFNDLDSIRFGFRAFTNGIAGNGLFFRNPFSGSDIFVADDFQDGEWYQIRIVLDADKNTYTVFINGEELAQTFYDGSGFVTSKDFRIMGRKTGSSTLIDYRFYAWANRAVLPGDADRVDSELLQLELEEGEGDTIENVSGVAVTSVTEPPTGVRPDEPVQLSVTVTGQDVTPDDVLVDSSATVSAADGIDWSGFYSLSGSIETDETEDGVVIDIEFSSTEEIPIGIPEGGMCYESSITVEVDGEPLLDEEWNTYTFQQVDTVATVLAHSKNEQPALTGAQLYSDLRDTAEFVCEWYASTLGSAGGHGFDFRFVTRDAPDGWIELEETRSTYHAGDGMPIGFVEDALDAAATELAVIFDSYTTAFVVSPGRLGRPYYRGDPLPSGFTIPIGGYEVEVPPDVINDAMPISAYDTPTGRTDVAYESVDGGAWRHEFGHSLGNGNRIGLPDLYEIDPEMGLVTNWGDIKGWGMMGNGSERPFMSYCRMLGGDFIDRGKWLEKDRSIHFFDDTDVSLTPLTEQQLGDDAAFLTSVYGEVAISVDYPSRSDPFTRPSVEFSTANFQLQTYILEARKSGTSPIRDPRTNDRVDRSPSDNDGVALYKFGYIRVDGEVEVERILDGDIPVSVEKITPLALDFVPPRSWEPDEPTLSIDRGPGHDTYEEPDNALEFEQEQSVSAGEAEVLVERDPETLIGDGLGYVERFITELIDFLGDLEDDLLPGGPGGVSLPGVDILLETPDGRRAGVDPETGEIYEEIDGSSVTGTERRRVVSVPGGLDLDVTLSTRRFREALEANDIEPPEEIPYRREHVVDKDLSIREENGLPMLDGRTRQIVDTSSVEDTERALVTGTAEVTPERLQVGSSGEFVTAYIEFDEPVDHESVIVETVTMDGVQAVHDDQYGFVENPVVERDGETAVMVKFDRQAVVDAFDVGEHEVVVQGLVNDTTIRATGQLELFEPGNAGGGPPGR